MSEKREVQDSLKWPATKDKDGSPIVVIPYKISDDLKERARFALHQAIQDYKKFTCIRFVPRENDEKDYVKFVKDRGLVYYS